MSGKIPIENPRDSKLRTKEELIAVSIREKTFTIDFEIIKRFFDIRAKDIWNSS